MTIKVVCRGCGVEFEYQPTRVSGRKREWCSAECYRAHYQPKRKYGPYPLTDEARQRKREQDRVYYAANKERLLASDREHYRSGGGRERAAQRYRDNVDGRRDKALARAKRPTPQPRICEQCGRVYTPIKNHPENRFCSRACRDRTWRYTRRAALHNAEREPYCDEEIFERDGWVCGICGGKIRSSLKHPHPESASIDHILPVSCGGSDTPANVQAAHLRCNCAKSNRAMNDQLLLVG